MCGTLHIYIGVKYRVKAGAIYQMKQGLQAVSGRLGICTMGEWDARVRSRLNSKGLVTLIYLVRNKLFAPE